MNQDCVEYTKYDKYGNIPVDGLILQGPVSDREAFAFLMDPDDMAEACELAAKLIAEDNGDDCLPRDSVFPYVKTPITAYRWDSLARE